METSTYTVAASGLKVDVHLPTIKRRPGKLPVLFAIHPGGLVSYGRTLIAPWLIQLAAREGWAVVSPEYRLLLGKGAGAADGCLDDVLAAYAWAFTGSDRHDFDPERVGVVGFSAGGLLSLLVPTQMDPSIPAPSAVVALYPVVSPLTSAFYSTARPTAAFPSLDNTDDFWDVARALYDRVAGEDAVTDGDGVGLDAAEKARREQKGGQGYRGMLYDWLIEKGSMRNVWLTGNPSPPSDTNPPLSSAQIDRLSPLSSANPAAALPPTFLVHGSADTLVPLAESQKVFAALQTLGGRDDRLSIVDGEEHAFELGDSLEGSAFASLFEQVGAWLKGTFRVE